MKLAFTSVCHRTGLAAKLASALGFHVEACRAGTDCTTFVKVVFPAPKPTR